MYVVSFAGLTLTGARTWDKDVVLELAHAAGVRYRVPDAGHRVPTIEFRAPGALRWLP